MISVTCPGCRTEVHLPDHLAGKTVRCKNCQQIFKVAALPLPPKPPASEVPVVQPVVKGSAKQSIDPLHEGLQSRPGRVPPMRKAESPARRAAASDPGRKSSPAFYGLLVGGGAVGALLLVGLVVAVVLLLRNKGGNDSKGEEPIAQAAPQPFNMPVKRDAVLVEPRAPGDGLAPGAAEKNDPHAQRQAPPEEAQARPAPQRPNAAPPQPPPDAKATAIPAKLLDEIKRATVFVKVEQLWSSGSGSGFLLSRDGTVGYVVTNHHVVQPEAPEPFGPRFGPRFIRPPMRMGPAAAATITVVFGSGTAQEQSLRAEVAASDKERDLAVLLVRGIKNAPTPIDTSRKPELLETTPVYMFGFPLGELVEEKRANPAVTVSPGSISAIRRDQRGRLDRIQLDIDMNPGNSGGPVVDGQGRLVGIAVSHFENTRLSFVIPPDKLTELVGGRITAAIFARKTVNQGAVELQGEAWAFDSTYAIRSAGIVNARVSSTNLSKTKKGTAEIDVQVHLIDPMRRIKQVAVHYKKAEDGQAEPAANADGSWSLLPGAKKLPLSLAEQKATATLALNAIKTTDRYVFQVEFQDGDGKTIYTQAHAFALDRPKPEVAQNPAAGGAAGAAAPAQPNRPPPAARKLFVKGQREFLSDLEEFDVKSGPWPVSKNGNLGDPEHKAIQVDGVRSPKGLSMHPPDGGYAGVKYRPGKQASVFKAKVALNDSTNFVFDSAVFEVWGDGKRLWRSEPIHDPKKPQEAQVDISAVDILELRVNATRSHFGLHAVWVEPRLLQKPDTPDKE
jgi:S1-C subfamily serine protease